MIPSIGRIVHYRLTEQDCAAINNHRVKRNALGNPATPGSVYPLIITRVWGDTHGSAVNGQVMLDGDDTLWVTSVTEGDSGRNWFVPPRVG